jgi:hypothetical protein
MIYKGEDKALSITITDSKGTLQDIDAMTNLIVYLEHDHPRSPLVKYSKVAAAGFTTLLRVSATEYTAIVPKTVTDTFSLAQLIIEVELQESDTRFPGSVRRTKGKGIITTISNSMINE